ncbi:hypothetical protein RHGRI_005469 [Rhododendron griersonianum]|uniref:Uncharacterized protein n=1 Tax=Rhododendron griersonianum TaxID=479676 RepID=A0AAV6LEX8_9ERIC|nr:hypothetical protein RHGRI_005469 [Rhododendron griersonianum]
MGMMPRNSHQATYSGRPERVYGAACGRQYKVRCISATVPKTSELAFQTKRFRSGLSIARKLQFLSRQGAAPPWSSPRLPSEQSPMDHRRQSVSNLF